MNKEEKISNQELIKLATRELNKMINSGGGSFTMCVPPRHDDTDSIFAELISRFSQFESDTQWNFLCNRVYPSKEGTYMVLGINGVIDKVIYTNSGAMGESIGFSDGILVKVKHIIAWKEEQK